MLDRHPPRRTDWCLTALTRLPRYAASLAHTLHGCTVLLVMHTDPAVHIGDQIRRGLHEEGSFLAQRGRLSLVCSSRQLLAGSSSFYSSAALPVSGLSSFSCGSSCPQPGSVQLPLFARAARRMRPKVTHTNLSQMQSTTSPERNQQLSPQCCLWEREEQAVVIHSDDCSSPQAETPPSAGAATLFPKPDADGTCIYGAIKHILGPACCFRTGFGGQSVATG